MEQIRLLSDLTFAANDGEGGLPRKFEGVAYSGGYVSRFGAVIDLAELRVADGMPLLSGHDHESVIGTVDSTSNDQRQLTVAGQLLSDIDQVAEGIAKKAKRGVRYQMSVGLFDFSEELVPAGKTVQVNGQSFSGPLAVLRGGLVREVSIVPLGADAKTSARFFHSPSNELGGKTMPTLEELQARVTQLEGELATSQAALQAANDETARLQQQIEASAKDARTEKVKALFAETGREATEEAMAPYLEMSDAAFDAAARDQRAIAAKVPERLFSSETPATPPNPQAPSLLLQAVEQRHGLTN